MTASWILSDIQALVNHHYGCPMDITVTSRDEDALRSPPWNPAVLSHIDRLMWDWNSQTTVCMDLVVWDFRTDSLQLVQSLCFKDIYPTRELWLHAIRCLLVDSPSIWIVRHRD